jgi:MinD superfamily P-loop ATPase
MKQQCNGCGSCKYVCKDNAITWEKKVIGKIYSGENHKMDFLGGELKTNEPISEFIVNSLNEILKNKKEDYDFIIIDTAAGTHCPVIAALEMCDKAYLVTEPTPLGKHDLEIILKLLKKLNKESKIVINRGDIGDKRLIRRLSEDYNVPIITEIPYSMEIIERYAKGLPVSSVKTIDIIGDLNT